ncbi:DUF3324 domain-containing protein [Erwinia sp. CPCC 100877]|nr:DUF3324 domain-containing protein [Erwinia sp. CPCC 100877]
MNFTVKAILPENQRSQEVSYYDLRVTPGQTQTLQLELSNDTDEDIVVQASANAAITNDNGIVDYSYKKTKKDSSAVYTFNELANLPEEISLPSHSKKTVDCVVTIPEKAFDGYILGGLYFEQKGGNEAVKSNESMAIGNRFSYVVGVLLSENDQEVQPELALNKVSTAQKNGNNVVLMNIQNKQPAMIKKLQVTAKLFYEDEKKPRYENHQEALTMAPNTNFNYKLDLKEQPFVAGNYTVKVTANDGFRDWHWEKSFTIKEKEAKAYNATAINLPPEQKQQWPWNWIIGGSIIVLLLVGGIIYYFRKKMKQQQMQLEKYQEHQEK